MVQCCRITLTVQMIRECLSDADMISALYRAFLEREPEPDAVVSLTARLNAGGLDARGLIAEFESCEEYRQRQRYGKELWVPPGHFYSPIVNLAELRDDAVRVFDRSRRPTDIDLNEAAQLAFVPVIEA